MSYVLLLQIVAAHKPLRLLRVTSMLNLGAFSKKMMDATLLYGANDLL